MLIEIDLRTYIHVSVSVHTYMSVSVCTVFFLKNREAGQQRGFWCVSTVEEE